MIEKMIRVACVFLQVFLFSACSSQESSEWVRAEALDCDAAVATCQVEVDDKLVTLSLQSGLVPLKPFSINATIANSETIGTVLIDFQMTGMEMGLNRYRLMQHKDGWQGTATLPVCTASRSDWVATMEFRRGVKRYRLVFPFTVQ